MAYNVKLSLATCHLSGQHAHSFELDEETGNKLKFIMTVIVDHEREMNRTSVELCSQHKSHIRSSCHMFKMLEKYTID